MSSSRQVFRTTRSRARFAAMFRLSGEAFAAAHRDLIERAHPTEVLRRDRTIGRPTLAELFADAPDKPTRDLRIQEARHRFCYRVSEIARHVSLHYASVSRIAAGRAAPPDLPFDRGDEGAGPSETLVSFID